MNVPLDPLPWPLPLRLPALEPSRNVQGEGRVFLGEGGSEAPPFPHLFHPPSSPHPPTPPPRPPAARRPPGGGGGGGGGGGTGGNGVFQLAPRTNAMADHAAPTDVTH